MSSESNRPALELFVSRLTSHSELSGEERDAIAALPFSRVEVRANRDVVRLGETVDRACLIERGLVGRFAQTQNGKRQFISLHLPGEMADLQALVVPGADAALSALTHSTLLRVPHEALQDLMAQHPAIATAFLRDCVVQGEIVAQWLVNVGRRDSRTRLSHLFCEMAVRHGRSGEAPALRYKLPMTQEHLGDALALTPVHVNRTLVSLRDDALVSMTRGAVEIHRWKDLADVGEFQTRYLHMRSEQENA